jgi:hypothetical protein
MIQTEIYTYNKQELNENRVNVSKNEINNIIYITEKTLGSIYNPNSDLAVGTISYLNELVLNPKNSFTTSIGTILTNKGSLVFNFNYISKFNDTTPSDNLLLTAKPTFVSGEYLMYTNVKITVQILQARGERILSIEYE